MRTDTFVAILTIHHRKITLAEINGTSTIVNV